MRIARACRTERNPCAANADASRSIPKDCATAAGITAEAAHTALGERA